MIVAAAGLLALLSAGPEICQRGAGPLRTLDFPDGSRIAGAGSTHRGDTTWYGWTGAACVASISVSGVVMVSDDERQVVPMRGGRFVVTSAADSTREYRIQDV